MSASEPDTAPCCCLPLPRDLSPASVSAAATWAGQCAAWCSLGPGLSIKAMVCRLPRSGTAVPADSLEALGLARSSSPAGRGLLAGPTARCSMSSLALLPASAGPGSAASPSWLLLASPGSRVARLAVTLAAEGGIMKARLWLAGPHRAAASSAPGRAGAAKCVLCLVPGRLPRQEGGGRMAAPAAAVWLLSHSRICTAASGAWLPLAGVPGCPPAASTLCIQFGADCRLQHVKPHA